MELLPPGKLPCDFDLLMDSEMTICQITVIATSYCPICFGKPCMTHSMFSPQPKGSLPKPDSKSCLNVPRRCKILHRRGLWDFAAVRSVISLLETMCTVAPNPKCWKFEVCQIATISQHSLLLFTTLTFCCTSHRV